ncbi:MAG: BspA family leucine-rich repeat surface protein [Corynebacterium sp.]|nr:BspA family leucine-rich repeat surface protein [Corynebacterium sp.]
MRALRGMLAFLISLCLVLGMSPAPGHALPAPPSSGIITNSQTIEPAPLESYPVGALSDSDLLLQLRQDKVNLYFTGEGELSRHALRSALTQYRQKYRNNAPNAVIAFNKNVKLPADSSYLFHKWPGKVHNIQRTDGTEVRSLKGIFQNSGVENTVLGPWYLPRLVDMRDAVAGVQNITGHCIGWITPESTLTNTKPSNSGEENSGLVLDEATEDCRTLITLLGRSRENSHAPANDSIIAKKIEHSTPRYEILHPNPHNPESPEGDELHLQSFRQLLNANKDAEFSVTFTNPVYLPEDSSYAFADSKGELHEFENLKFDRVKDMRGMFKNSNLTGLNLALANLDRVQNMTGAFENASGIDTESLQVSPLLKQTSDDETPDDEVNKMYEHIISELYKLPNFTETVALIMKDYPTISTEVYNRVKAYMDYQIIEYLVDSYIEEVGTPWTNDRVLIALRMIYSTMIYVPEKRASVIEIGMNSTKSEREEIYAQWRATLDRVPGVPTLIEKLRENPGTNDEEVRAMARRLIHHPQVRRLLSQYHEETDDEDKQITTLLTLFESLYGIVNPYSFDLGRPLKEDPDAPPGSSMGMAVLIGVIVAVIMITGPVVALIQAAPALVSQPVAFEMPPLPALGA